MKCPFATGEYMLSCAAHQAYVPSMFELDEYCKTTRHTLCPFFIKKYADSPYYLSAVPAE